MTKVAKWEPLVWELMAVACIVGAFFVSVERGRFLLLAGTMAWVRSDTLSIRVRLDEWTRL